MIHRVDGKEAWERASGEGQDFERQVGTNPKAPLKSRDFTLDSKGPIAEGLKQRSEKADPLIRKTIPGWQTLPRKGESQAGTPCAYREF